MAYDINQAKTYNHSPQKMSQVVADVLTKLGGKADKKSNPAAGQFMATFNKQVKNQMLPNRVQIVVKTEEVSPESSRISIAAYPVDPLGNKLMFGVRGNATRTVVDSFFSELEAQAG
ncbi:MAG: hypothetical protein BroJett011_22560 [Chloroflexota bacterium]|nr:MAG: hypothetical protein BroJett011_22560 [Chloroflexota bacterium]